MTLLLIVIATAYLGFIFGAAWYFEKRLSNVGFRRWMPYIYALALAVYCTAWTFYGSIGRAAESGFDFLLIYIGPTLVMFLWYPIARKLYYLKVNQGIGSLADLLSSRYGKDAAMGKLVAALSLIGVLPYISLQIKAISESFTTLSGSASSLNTGFSLSDPALYVSLIMFAFTIFFGTRYVQNNRPKAGLIGTIAFESLFKLLAFLVVGLIGLNSFLRDDRFYSALDRFRHQSFELPTADWASILLISGLSFMLLPRQFQMGVVENTSEKNIPKALWLVPLYMLVLNLLVLPFALMGPELAPGTKADFYLLSLSLQSGGPATAALAFLGGLSAATSMIIVSTLALGNMFSTHVLVPQIVWNKDKPLDRRIIGLRRWAIFGILILAYFYYHYIAVKESLVSIGMVSFVAISQFAPAFFGALFWKQAHRKAAFAGIATGFGIWFYFLVLPEILNLVSGDPQLLDWASPQLIANSMGVSVLSAATIFSLLVNASIFIGWSLNLEATQEEENQATLFVKASSLLSGNEAPEIYRGSAPFPDIKSLLNNFLGNERTEKVLDRYARLNNIDWSVSPTADSRVISYAERLLSEAIGPASAKIMISSVVQREELSRSEVLGILEESQKVLRLNRELSTRSEELRKATEDLRQANYKLQELTELKDEFLYTVTHELRTPLTAIRTQSELVHDDPEMPEEDRQRFIGNMVQDCERLTRLISNVLDLEKFESGSQKLSLNRVDLGQLIEDTVTQFQALAAKKGHSLRCEISAPLTATYADEDRIAQVLHNLIGNALKHARHDNGAVWITAYRLDQDLKVNIHDNGNGIPLSDRELVFDKFYQVRNQTRRKPSGSGLGLAISKNIIQMHKGKIWIEDNPGGGAKISFTLPLYLQEAQMKNSKPHIDA